MSYPRVVTVAARRLATPSSVNAAIKQIADVMRRANYAGALQYVPELSWILFLRILDEREELEAEEARALDVDFAPSLQAPFRWRDWASPGGAKRSELSHGAMGAFLPFVNDELLPYLRGLGTRSGATIRQRVISQVVSAVDKVDVDTERNLLDILDRVDDIHLEAVDQTHLFTLSQAYEGLLQKMGEKNNDGGQFFTPREVIRAIVRAVDPKVGETVYDPGCGTGGFLAQAFEWMRAGLGAGATAEQLRMLREDTFFGREKADLVYPIALANLVLHGIDHPHIWHGNTLTSQTTYDGLFTGAPSLYDVVLMNPPFGGKEGKEAQTNFAYKTGATQVLFLQHVVDSLKSGGRCGMVIDEGVLFRNNETAFVQTKRKLLNDCDLWCIVSLPPGVFSSAGAGVKTNLLFFTKGGPTERVWYYDLSDIKVTKKQPLTVDRFEEFFSLLPMRTDSEHSWTVTRDEIEARRFDLKAVNPNAKSTEDTRTPEELLDIIETKGREVDAAIAELRRLLATPEA
ncbi:MAG: N-6 DNA methylase [Chloroflexi bacterium]|nr:N-6 DNA methylase [Chloroflexota bacterium]